MIKKERLDQKLVDLGYFNSCSKVQGSILAGKVYVDDKKIVKPGSRISPGSIIRVLGQECPYVSRGGLKLETALKVFNIQAEGKTVVDAGAGTGGFTDCLLQRGAKKVYAIDVGYGQLAWKIRQDPRVVTVERTNVRYLTPEKLYALETAKADLATIDVSFISLAKVLPAIKDLLNEKGEIVALIKPQFEAGREFVEKGGLVKNPKVHQSVLEQVAEVSQNLGLKVLGFTHSPIRGMDGNMEFFMHLGKGTRRRKIKKVKEKIKDVVKQAHATFL